MKAFYAGSFDPFTIGHLSIVRKALEIFPELIVGIGVNKSKIRSQDVEQRILNIQRICRDMPGVTVFAYDGLTAEVARENGAGVLVRGVRNSLDFVKEKELSDINLKVFGMATIFIPADPELTYVSSSMVRELAHFGGDPSPFLP